MREHNSDYSGKRFIIEIKDNGWSLKNPSFEGSDEIYQDFSDVVNRLAFMAGLAGIGENVTIEILE